MLAHNILYTYIAPFVEQAGLGKRIDLVLLTFGLAALVGIWFAGILVDRYLRIAILTSLLAFALIALLFGFGAQSPEIIYIGVVVWGITFGGASTFLQTALADAAGSGADVALSMNVVAWNLAIAGGGIVGGILLDSVGVSSFPWSLLALLSVAFLIAWSYHSHAFKSGARISESSVAQ